MAEIRKNLSGDEIRALRIRLGMEREELAKALGLRERTLQNIENGGQNLGGPAQRMLLELARQKDGQTNGAMDMHDSGPVYRAGCTHQCIEAICARLSSVAADQNNMQLAETIAKARNIPVSRAWFMLFHDDLKDFLSHGKTGNGGSNGGSGY